MCEYAKKVSSKLRVLFTPHFYVSYILIIVNSAVCFTRLLNMCLAYNLLLPSIQYDEGELYEQFIVFYNDVLPEFRMAGKVVQFKVSIKFIYTSIINNNCRCLATMSHILEGTCMYSFQRKFTLSTSCNLISHYLL